MSAVLVANARMYAVTPSVKADWKLVFDWALAQAGLPWEGLDYDAPAPLSALWARDDLGLAMMCGLPFAQRPVRPTVVAAPVPSPARYGGRPVYFTDIVVRADAPYRSLEDTFGAMLGYTLADSMSGGVALRCHLQTYQQTYRQNHLQARPWYRQAVGGLVNARGVIDALLAGRIDVGPVDSYYYALLQRNDPGFASQVRVVASTPAMPIPPLVATAALSAADLARLQHSLLAVQAAPELAAVRERLQLQGFALVDAWHYQVLADMAANATWSFDGARPDLA
ncbi:phosphate/phosphite/phosphonate ABC transporter substrate-binding protein [Rhodoferax sp.]|uniref:phosphate/phosphite/phosphonate ABC transporter substrate-binding protein n=1 Tax=Rhodoferax sp. TaxID=50421 RepID=UPI00374DCAA7